MRNLLVLIFIFPSVLFANTNLLLIGGGTKPAKALQSFSYYAQQKQNPNILVISWGTSDPAAAFEGFRADISKHFPQEKIFAAPTFEQMSAKRAVFLEQLKLATAVFFTGGDQNKIMEVIVKLDLKNQLEKKYTDGFIFGGTSAGTAIMSDPMIAGDGDPTVLNGKQVPIAHGLGLVKGIIFDMHFVKRQRQNRLMGLILAYPQYKGLGINESAAVLLENGTIREVIGGISLLYTPVSKKNALLTEVLTPKSY